MQIHQGIDLTLVIPAYNEAAIIVANVHELDNYMKAQLPDICYEILIVDDGSTDGMARILTDAEAEIPTMRHVSHLRNRGRGRGVRTGIEHARGTFLIFLDADLSYAPDHIPRLLTPLQEGLADITLASAYHPEGSVNNVPLGRALMSRYGNKMLSSGFRSNLHTVTCIVRGFRRDVIDQLDLINDGKDLHLELLQKAELFNFRILEIPAYLNWRDRKRGSKPKRRLRDFVPFLNMSGTIASHLVYSYVLRPSGLLNVPLAGLAIVMLLASGSLIWSFVEKVTAYGSISLEVMYRSLRETLIQGQLTALVFTISLIVSILLLAFYFASQQSKRYYEDMYVLLNRMNARIKELERERPK